MAVNNSGKFFPDAVLGGGFAFFKPFIVVISFHKFWKPGFILKMFKGMQTLEEITARANLVNGFGCKSIHININTTQKMPG